RAFVVQRPLQGRIDDVVRGGDQVGERAGAAQVVAESSKCPDVGHGNPLRCGEVIMIQVGASMGLGLDFAPVHAARTTLGRAKTAAKVAKCVCVNLATFQR